MDRTDWTILIVGGGIIVLFLCATLWAAFSDAAYRRACYTAGGIPISGYCIKPDSFIEVK